MLRIHYRNMLAGAVLVGLAWGNATRAALVLDDTLQGSTLGTREGGALGADGWKVTGKNDTIYWHVPTITQGAVEFDVRGLNPNECRVGMEDKSELFHMYDYTFGNADVNYNGGYRDGTFKHFIRKTGCADTRPGKTDSLELLWQILPNYTEQDSAVLAWSSNTTYHFREEWGPSGGNSVIRTYRDGVLLATMTMPGSWNPAGHSVRIAASPRRSPDAGAPLGAVFSNVKVWDLLSLTPATPAVTHPANNATVNTPLVFIQWTGDSHTRYQVRINHLNEPDSGIVWDSGIVASPLNHAWVGPLPNLTTNFVFVRLANSGAWSPWSIAGRRFLVDPTFVPSGTDLVRVEGHSLRDNAGPFLGLGASYFTALRRTKYDRARLTNDLAFLASKKMNYVRTLSMVGWYEAWQGLEIAPVSFINRVGGSVAAWPDYWQQFRDMIDIIYSYGMRAEVTIFADAQLMPSKSARIAHMNTMLQNLVGREHKVILLEVANEAWQNGFPGAQGVTDLREFAQYLADRTTLPVAITSNHGDPFDSLYAGSAADIATWHFSRDIGTVEGGWLPVRDCYNLGNLPGRPPVSSNEPIGPGSSVNSENDPIKLVMAAAFAWTANLPMYVYHTSAGVFGQVTFQNMAGVGDYVHLQNILPPDLASWVRNDGREASAPFTAFANGQADKWWTEVTSPTSGVVRNTGASKSGEFVTLPIGILNGGVILQARRPVKFRVYNPLTGAVVTNVTLNTGNQVSLPRGPGAYIVRGSFRDTGTPLVPQGAKWKYLDKGSNQGTAWRAPAYNDGTWLSGSAQLGYGDDDEATVVSFGPNEANKYVTTYFRRAFPVADPSLFSNFTLRLLRDDGAIVYLNNVEVFRSNMPTGAVGYTTLASSVIPGTDEVKFFTTNVNPSLVLTGTNVLAVEVHQAAVDSSDISFDLELNGESPPPLLSITRFGNSLVLSWPASAAGYQLQSASSLSQSPTWSPLPNAVVTSNNQNMVLVSISGANTYYRLWRQ